MPAQFGMIGLGTMGRNLVLNMADKGIIVCGYDRDEAQRSRLQAESAGKNVLLAASMQELVNNLESPRRIMMLVPAGKIVDLVIDEVSPLLKPGDILIDGGNSHYTDTDKRILKLTAAGIHFTGMGVSGGESGARSGPSMMPGGNEESYQELKPILEKIAAQTSEGPCVAFTGYGSAGHFTKMVHNGIEYAMMQLISEVYSILLRSGKFSDEELCDIFKEWNDGELKSFLIEITAIVLEKKDDFTGQPLVKLVLDKAKQKGTGMWTSISALELNVPIPTIDVSVSMRYISSLKEIRVKASGSFEEKPPLIINDKQKLKSLCKDALLFSFALSYGQGLHLLTAASDFYSYKISIPTITRIWKGGCIIRSSMLNDLQLAYEKEKALPNIIHSDIFKQKFLHQRKDVSDLVKMAIDAGIPVAALSASLQYFNAFVTAELPANLIQAQRDFFGAHTYERKDREGIFHSNWEE